MGGKAFIVCGALLAAAGVLAGAYGAHGLDKHLEKYDLSPAKAEQRVDDYEVAVRYQMYHALGMVAAGLLAMNRRSAWLTIAATAWIAGIVLFSGCLYLRVFDQPIPGVLVMIGGLSYTFGWCAFAIGAARATNAAPQTTLP